MLINIKQSIQQREDYVAINLVYQLSIVQLAYRIME